MATQFIESNNIPDVATVEDDLRFWVGQTSFGVYDLYEVPKAVILAWILANLDTTTAAELTAELLNYYKKGEAIADIDIPAAIARDSEVAALFTSHGAATDPHPTYLTQVEAAALFAPIGFSGSAQGGLRFNAPLTTGTPLSGEIRFNTTNPALATTITISETDRNGGSVTDLLGLIVVGDRLQVVQEDNEEIYAFFRVTAISDTGDQRVYTVVVASAPTTVTNGTTPFFVGEITLERWGIPGGGHQILLNGVAATQRSKLEIAIAGAVLTDDAAGDRTLITLPASSSGSGGASGIKFTYSDQDPPTTVGQIRTLQASLAIATDVVINPNDVNGDSAIDVLSRLEIGDLFTIAKDNSNYVRFEVTSPYAAGSVGVTVRAEQGVINTLDTVYLSPDSDAVAIAGVSSSLSAGQITATAGNGSLTWANTASPSGMASPLAYEWYGSTTQNFDVGTPTKIAGATLPTFSENNLAVGTYYRRRVAIDALGLKLSTPETPGAVTVSAIDGFFQNLVSALTANGYTPTTLEQNALSAFSNSINSLKSAVARMYGFVGATANTHRISWMNPASTSEYLTTVGTITHSANGVTIGANAGGYRSDYIIPAAAQNSLAYGLYLGNVLAANQNYCGSQLLSSSVGNIISTGNAPNISFRNNAATQVTTSVASYTNGWVSNSRNNSTQVITHTTDNAFTTITSSSNAGTGYFDDPISRFGIGGYARSDGSFFSTAGTNVRHAVIFNRGLTQTELGQYRDAVVALQTALSRV